MPDVNDLIERLRNGTAHLSLRQIEELWADAAGALEAAMKTQQLGQTKPAQDDNLYRLSLLVESDVLPDGLEVRRVVKAALQEFAALRRAADRITELQDEVVRLKAEAEFLHTRRGQLVIERDKAREALNETIIDLNVYTDIGIIRARAIERRAALDQQGAGDEPSR